MATQIIIKSYFEMTSPSFWVNTISNLLNGLNCKQTVTIKPEDVKDTVIPQFLNNRDNLSENLNSGIEENKRLINKFSKLVEKPLPLKLEPRPLTNWNSHEFSIYISRFLNAKTQTKQLK